MTKKYYFNPSTGIISVNEGKSLDKATKLFKHPLNYEESPILRDTEEEAIIYYYKIKLRKLKDQRRKHISSIELIDQEICEMDKEIQKMKKENPEFWV